MTTITPVNNLDLGSVARSKINANDANLNNDKLETSLKGAANGLAELDGSGKLPVAQLPVSAMEYKGTWNASTNTPTLADGVGNTGDIYSVSVAGTQDLGSGNITFAAGDWVIYNGTIWEKSINSNAVASVFGRTGAVSATNGDYNAGQVTNTPAGSIAAVTVQAAINELDNEKEPNITATTSADYYRGDKTFQTLNKAAVALGNVENLKVNLVATSDPLLTDSSLGGYAVGSRWINTSNDKEFVCLNSTPGAAVWKETTQIDTNITNLGYTASATDGTVTSSTGTDATLPLATPTGGSNEAGLLAPADKTKLDNTSGINTGDQTITLTGDVTGSGTGSFAATIANDSVTLAKMQNAVASSKLVGSGSAGAGADYAELTVGSNLTMTGTTLSADTQAGTTNLGYTASATDGTVTSDTGTNATLPLVTSSLGSNEAGLMIPSDKTKLDTVANGATANSTDAYLLNRTNHTGTQTASTISDFDTEVANNSAVTANTAKVTNATHTGDVTGATALTIANNAVTNAKAAQMPTLTIKGNNTGGTANASDLTVTQVETMLTNTAKLNVAQEFTKQQNFNATTLSDAANIAWDLADNQVTSVTLAGNRTLDNPTNMVDGATYILTIKQDATGSRTLAYSSAYKFPNGIAPTLSTSPNGTDVLTFVSDGEFMYGTAQTNFDSSFEPSQISNLVWWLDADDASTITESGGSVSQWDDKSGNANHATQGTGSKQPTTNIRTINGRNAIDFDGTDDDMDFSFADIADTSYTVFMVEKRDDMSVTRSGPIASNGTGDQQFETLYFTNGNLSMGQGSKGIIQSVLPVDTTNTRVLGWTHDATNGNVAYVNGSSTGTNPGPEPDITAPLQTGAIGSRANGVFYDGAICELIFYDKELSSSELAVVFKYLEDKWGV